MLLLDTAALVWTVQGNRRLGRHAAAVLRRAAAGTVGYSVVSLYEIGLLAGRGRISLQADLAAWRRELLANGFIEHALHGEHAVRATDLSGLPSDPADRLIVATAIVTGATLVTSDEKILAWQGHLDRIDAEV